MDLCCLVLCRQSIQSLYDKHLLTERLIKLRVKIVNEPAHSDVSALLNRTSTILGLKDWYIKVCIFQGELCIFSYLYGDTHRIMARACFLRDAYWFDILTEFDVESLDREAALMTDVPEIQAKALIVSHQYMSRRWPLYDILSINWTPGLRQAMLKHLIPDLDIGVAAYLGVIEGKYDNPRIMLCHILGSFRFGFRPFEGLSIDPSILSYLYFLAGKSEQVPRNVPPERIEWIASILDLIHLPVLWKLNNVTQSVFRGYFSTMVPTRYAIKNITQLLDRAKIRMEVAPDERARLFWREMVVVCSVVLGAPFEHKELPERYSHLPLMVAHPQTQNLNARYNNFADWFASRILYDPIHMDSIFPSGSSNIASQIWARGQVLGSKTLPQSVWSAVPAPANFYNQEIISYLSIMFPNICNSTVQLVQLLSHYQYHKYRGDKYHHQAPMSDKIIRGHRTGVTRYHENEIKEGEVQELEREKQRKKKTVSTLISLIKSGGLEEIPTAN